MADEDTLEQIAAEIQVCTRCDLHVGARNGVPGAGDPRAEVMLVGEAPSLYDDRRGTPFSGPSGVFLDELLALVGLSRSSVYLTNVVKHRVPETRELLPAEITACASYLTRQIAVVNPKVIVALGRAAAGRFFPKARITQLHGQFKLVDGRVVVAMYNPAAALHKEELRQTVIDDFARAIPAALAEAGRLAAAGKLGAPDRVEDNEPPQQLSLF
jgi:uracil-DNA glycosylase family 4